MNAPEPRDDSGDPGAAAVASSRVRWVTDRDSLGQLDALFPSRAHRGVIDCVLVRGETEAIASRVRDQHDPADPFRAPPNAVLWSYVGDLVAAVSELLDLPAPGERGAPSLARRGPSELWIPHSEFHR